MKGLTEDKYTTTATGNINENLNVHHYPYSIGDLSEMNLYREQQIIKGYIDHPEAGLDKDKAISQLLNGRYENTPSYSIVSFNDEGYFFETDGRNSNLMIGWGGRTHWSSNPFYADISMVEYKDNVYTVYFVDPHSLVEESEQFYRINESVIYRKSSNGEFVERFEQDTEWNDFHGMPELDNVNWEVRPDIVDTGD